MWYAPTESRSLWGPRKYPIQSFMLIQYSGKSVGVFLGLVVLHGNGVQHPPFTDNVMWQLAANLPKHRTQKTVGIPSFWWPHTHPQQVPKCLMTLGNFGPAMSVYLSYPGSAPPCWLSNHPTCLTSCFFTRWWRQSDKSDTQIEESDRIGVCVYEIGQQRLLHLLGRINLASVKMWLVNICLGIFRFFPFKVYV